MTFPIPDGLDDAVAAAAWDPGLSAWPMDVITGMLRELLDLLSTGKLHTDIEKVPLSAAGEVWARDQQGRRPVFIP